MMAKKTSININPEIWGDARKLAIDRRKTVGELVEELLARELKKERK